MSRFVGGSAARLTWTAVCLALVGGCDSTGGPTPPPEAAAAPRLLPLPADGQRTADSAAAFAVIPAAFPLDRLRTIPRDEAFEDVEAPAARGDASTASEPENKSTEHEPKDVPWPRIVPSDASQPAVDDAAPSEEWPRASQDDAAPDQPLLQPAAPLLQPAPNESETVESATPESAPADDDAAKPATKINPESLPPSSDTTPPAEAPHEASASAESESAGSPLPWGPSVPGPELDAILARADRLNRQGFDLARRGALYSARNVFLDSIRLLAQALDVQRQTTAHAKALHSGWKALDEAEDFVSRGGAAPEVDLVTTIAAHRTAILKSAPAEELTCHQALARYLTFAQQQLAAAVSDLPAGSVALYGLGKVYAAPASWHGPMDAAAGGRSAVLYQAAILVDPKNHLAANELGVLMARRGRWDDAQRALELSLAVAGEPVAWQNLAAVYRRRGRGDLAERAGRQAAAIAQRGAAVSASRYAVQWVAPETFARTNVASVDSVQAHKTAPAAATASPTTAQQPVRQASGRQ